MSFHDKYSPPLLCFCVLLVMGMRLQFTCFRQGEGREERGGGGGGEVVVEYASITSRLLPGFGHIMYQYITVYFSIL